MYQQSLTQSGLTANQATIYEALLKEGALVASKVAQKTPLKRALVYKILDDLVGLGLVEKQEEPGKVAVFKPNHPLKLKDLAETREQRAKDAQRVLEGVLPSLVSDFNLISGRPGVRFYEGIEAFRQIAEDSLSAKGEIYSYVDNDAVSKYVPRENAEYVKKRARLGIKKKILTRDTPYIREIAKQSGAVTELRFMDLPENTFETVMQIYDNKISYLTLKKDTMIGIIIEDEYIARMHRVLFEYQWGRADTSPQPSPFKGEGDDGGVIPS